MQDQGDYPTYIQRSSGSSIEDGLGNLRRGGFNTALPVQEPNQIQELVKLLYRGRWLIAIAFILVFGGTAIYTMMQVPVYRAYSTVLLDQRLAPDLKDALKESSVQGGASRSVETEIFVVQQSLAVARQVAERLIQLEEDPVTGNAISLLSMSGNTEQLAYLVQRNVSIYPEIVPDILSITATSFEPGEARLLANLYSEEFVNHALGRSRSRLAGTRAFLENEVAERHSELQALEERMRQFMSQNKGVSLNASTSALVQQVTELEAMRDEVYLEERLKQLSIDNLNRELIQMEPHLAQRVSNNLPGEVKRIQSEIAGIESELAQIYRQDPGLRGSDEAAQSQIIQNFEHERTVLQQELGALSDAYIEEVIAFGDAGLAKEQDGGLSVFAELRRNLAREELEMSRLQARKAVVEKQLMGQQASLTNLPAQMIALSQLQRSLQTTERAYLSLRDKLGEVRISEESEQGYAELIRLADMPYRPEYPDKPKNLILGGLVGLLMGLGLAIGRQQISKDIVFTPEDIQKHGHDVIGVIPNMAETIRQQYGNNRQIMHNGYCQDACLISHQPASSFIVDAYRRLRFGVQQVSSVQTILVTSPNPGEGKSITALNLGIASAQSGRRTLIVDTDLRRPSLHKKLGIDSRPGFIKMINERRLQFRKAIESQDHLHVLTAGPPDANAAELLSSDEMPAFIDELKRLFDVIIFDSPPYMLVSDAVVLSTLCEGTIVVTAAGQTKGYELAQGMRDFKNAGSRVLGTVLNAFDPAEVYGSRMKYKYYRDLSNYAYEEPSKALLPS